jgi:hypothetical protein
MNIKFGQVNKILFWWLAKCRVDKKLWRHFFRGLLHRCRWLDLLSYFHDLKWTEEKKEKNRGLLKAPKIKAAPASLHQRLDDTSFPRLSSTFFSKETIIKTAKQLLKAPKIKAAPASLHQRLDDTSFPRLSSTFFFKKL